MYFLPSDNVKIIEHILNKQFSSIWKWLIDNKLLVHFGEDKPKPILSSEAIGLKEIIIYINIHIYMHIYICIDIHIYIYINYIYIYILRGGHFMKQHTTVEYLGHRLDCKFSGEAVALKLLRKTNVKL